MQSDSRQTASAPAAPSTRTTNSPTTRPAYQALAQDHEKLVQLYGSKANVSTVANNADYATMAAAAYKVGSEPTLASGWKREGSAGSYNGLGSFIHGKNEATVYRKGNEYVIAFQGTDGPGDVNTDLNPNSPQAAWARQVARDYVKQNPNHNVTFVGHSLGGRLARLARIETGRKAVVFNTSPLLNPKAILEEKTLNAAPGTAAPLMSFRAPGDPVSALTTQKIIEIKNFEHGDYSDVNPVIGSVAKPIQSHLMDQLAATMQATKSLNEWAKKTGQ